jgi:hypothetical protein
MRGETGADHWVCEWRFYGDWRMHLVFGDEENIVISWVGEHTEDEDVHAEGAQRHPRPQRHRTRSRRSAGVLR